MNMQKIRRVGAGIMNVDYVRWMFAWSSLEPVAGRYNWTPIYDKIKLGLPIVVRVYANYKGQGDKLPSYISATKYPYLDGGFQCYEYDYNDADIITANSNLAHAFAAEFNGHPMILALEIGIMGQYGEWTTYREGGGLRYTEQTQRQILSPWVDLMTMTPVLGRSPGSMGDQYQVSVGHEFMIGYYDDVIMHANSANIDTELSLYSIENRWEENLMGGEVYPPYGADVLQNRVDELEAFIKARHISYLHLSYTPANQTEIDAREHLRSVIKNETGYS